MKELNTLLGELGISKVKLAKYLGVSRQMIYNYLELDSLSKWPQEKRIMLLKLLDIEDGSEKTIKNIKITSEYLENVEARLNQNVKDSSNQIFNYKNLTKEEQELLNDLVFLIKEKLLKITVLLFHTPIIPAIAIPPIPMLFAYWKISCGLALKAVEFSEMTVSGQRNAMIGTPIHHISAEPAHIINAYLSPTMYPIPRRAADVLHEKNNFAFIATA